MFNDLVSRLWYNKLNNEVQVNVKGANHRKCLILLLYFASVVFS